MKNTFKEITELYSRKQKEYKGEVNPFRNFEKASELRGISREEALDFFRLKHEVSILEMLDDDKKYSKAVITEKFNDYIIYTIILNEMINSTFEGKDIIFEFITLYDFVEMPKNLSLGVFMDYIEHCQLGEYNLYRPELVISALISLKNNMLDNRSYE